MNDQLLLTVCIFGAVALLGLVSSRLLLSVGGDSKIRSRLAGSAIADLKPRQRRTFKTLLQSIGQAAARPFMPRTREKQSSLRRKLGYAGIYSASAVKVMTGGKVLCLVGGLIAGYLIGGETQWLLSISMGGLVGYCLPSLWLRIRIKRNQNEINIGLPDALDLMVVCVEAGLTLDSALQRVGQELTIAHPTISRELGIAHMETRVGLSRSESLRNLSVRTGSPALQSLSAMLIQADRFGTSIASALRIHADSLRVARQAAAEEIAAKASVKLSFPLVLFIFPAIFIVLVGPTIVTLMKNL